ncbi:aldose 1-epimerase [Roseibium aquae]|uniref:Aldose 1-epimerase n=1 Tax=Roseibium aquae TaxID=1323746 RepID=A0A916X2Y8_9HYPH|nr:aldose epimerase family protein [Roseibium aquae]GGB57448.1 aldose 1-epimerase [Roseibium aquae]
MITDFGSLPDGRAVQEITLKKGGLEAGILTYGAAVRDLRFNGHRTVLGFDQLDGYLVTPTFFGAIVGRCANRIAHGRFELDGRVVELGVNEPTGHHLHGGTGGFSQRLWTLEQHDKSSVLLKLVSKDGEEGYPGQVDVLVRYSLTGAGALRVKMTATTDRPTAVNLSTHCYFNLSGEETISNHRLEIAADSYLPVDGDKIPTGEIRKVAWTPFDFQDGRPIAAGGGPDYDHNYCLAGEPRDTPEFAAALEDPAGDCRMEVWTTEPGLQFYDGAGIHCPVPGLDGRSYGPKAGLCLEPQRWPDAPNRPSFPSAILRPGETYTHLTEYRFS